MPEEETAKPFPQQVALNRNGFFLRLTLLLGVVRVEQVSVYQTVPVIVPMRSRVLGRLFSVAVTDLRQGRQDATVRVEQVSVYQTVRVDRALPGRPLALHRSTGGR